MNPAIKNFALNMLARNPKQAQSPMGQQLLNALNSNDDAAGEALANNIIKTNGLQKDQAIQQAYQGFQQAFTGGNQR